jgi:hypothetical protein
MLEQLELVCCARTFKHFQTHTDTQVRKLSHLPPTQDIVPRHPADNPAVQHLYCSRVPGGPGSRAARDLLHTSYRKRDSTVATTATVSDW